MTCTSSTAHSRHPVHTGKSWTRRPREPRWTSPSTWAGSSAAGTLVAWPLNSCGAAGTTFLALVDKDREMSAMLVPALLSYPGVEALSHHDARRPHVICREELTHPRQLHHDQEKESSGHNRRGGGGREEGKLPSVDSEHLVLAVSLYRYRLTFQRNRLSFFKRLTCAALHIYNTCVRLASSLSRQRKIHLSYSRKLLTFSTTEH